MRTHKPTRTRFVRAVMWWSTMAVESAGNCHDASLRREVRALSHTARVTRRPRTRTHDGIRPPTRGVMSRASVHATDDMNHNGDCELRRVGSTSSVAALGRLWRCFLRREVERRPAGALHEATVHERPASAVRPTYACIHTCQGSGATDADTTCCGTGASGRRCPRPNAWRESARRHSRRGRRRHPDGGGGAFSRTPSGPRASLAQTRTPYARAEQGTQLHTGKPTRASICTTNA